MRIIRKTNILVKTERKLTAYRQTLNDETILCPQCGEKMFDARSAAEFLDTSVREVYRLVEAGKLHFYETDEKTGYLCLKSIRGNAE